jgi:glutaredoxin
MNIETTKRRMLVLGVCALLSFGAAREGRSQQTLLQAAEESKRSGLPLFVMFSTQTCPFCVEMKKRLQTEPELTALITTQYVFIEASASEPTAKQFIEQYKITVSGVPHTTIVSSKGELLTERVGLPRDSGLLGLLKEGIDKSGGMKDTAEVKRQKEVEAAVKQIAAAKDKLSNEETMVAAMVELVAINRKFARVKEVKKEMTPVFAAINKDKSQVAVLAQARMLETADAAVEAKKDKVAEAAYDAVIKKYPDTPAAKYAHEKLGHYTSLRGR